MWDNKEMLQPSECLLRDASLNKRQTFGIPKENQAFETRLALTPEAVALLVEEGHRVVVESGAGLGMHYTDLRYSECGAIIVNSAAEVFSADIVLKISPPTPEEILLMREKATLFSMLQLSLFSAQSIKLMMQKKIIAIAYELIKDDQRNFPVVASMSEIDGITAVSIAAQYMSNESGGKGLLLGGIAGVSSAEVLVLGAGIAGSTAARTALALGAQVKIFDHDVNKLRKFQQQYGQHVFTSVIHPRVLFKALASADVVIGTLKYINGSERFMVSEELVKTMKNGSVIVDLSVDQGGCFETSECRSLSDPAYRLHGVVHYCVPNLSSRVGRTASIALSNIFVPLMLKIGQFGGIGAIVNYDRGLRNGIYLYNGMMVNRLVGDHFNLPASDIGLFTV